MIFTEMKLYNLLDIDREYYILFYNLDDNTFTNIQGDILFNLYDFFTPKQVMLMKKDKRYLGRPIKCKQGEWVTIVWT